MKNLLTIIILYVLLSMSQAWSVPVCTGSPKVYKEGGNPEWNNCTGTLTWDGGSVTGKFIKGVLPYGTITFADGNKYVGEFKDERYHGKGTETYSSGDKYVGEWKDGKKNGQGTYTFADGRKYVGEWKDNKYNGQGTETYTHGDKYLGEFKDDQYNGQGIYTFADGTEWKGQWKNNEWVSGRKYAAGEFNPPVKESNNNKQNVAKAEEASCYTDRNSPPPGIDSLSGVSGWICGGNASTIGELFWQDQYLTCLAHFNKEEKRWVHLDYYGYTSAWEGLYLKIYENGNEIYQLSMQAPYELRNYKNNSVQSCSLAWSDSELLRNLLKEDFRKKSEIQKTREKFSITPSNYSAGFICPGDDESTAKPEMGDIYKYDPNSGSIVKYNKYDKKWHSIEGDGFTVRYDQTVPHWIVYKNGKISYDISFEKDRYVIYSYKKENYGGITCWGNTLAQVEEHTLVEERWENKQEEKARKEQLNREEHAKTKDDPKMKLALDVLRYTVSGAKAEQKITKSGRLYSGDEITIVDADNCVFKQREAFLDAIFETTFYINNIIPSTINYIESYKTNVLDEQVRVWSITFSGDNKVMDNSTKGEIIIDKDADILRVQKAWRLMFSKACKGASAGEF